MRFVGFFFSSFWCVSKNTNLFKPSKQHLNHMYLNLLLTCDACEFCFVSYCCVIALVQIAITPMHFIAFMQDPVKRLRCLFKRYKIKCSIITIIVIIKQKWSHLHVQTLVSLSAVTHTQSRHPTLRKPHTSTGGRCVYHRQLAVIWPDYIQSWRFKILKNCL